MRLPPKYWVRAVMGMGNAINQAPEKVGCMGNEKASRHCHQARPRRLGILLEETASLGHLLALRRRPEHKQGRKTLCGLGRS